MNLRNFLKFCEDRPNYQQEFSILFLIVTLFPKMKTQNHSKNNNATTKNKMDEAIHPLKKNNFIYTF